MVPVQKHLIYQSYHKCMVTVCVLHAFFTVMPFTALSSGVEPPNQDFIRDKDLFDVILFYFLD